MAMQYLLPAMIAAGILSVGPAGAQPSRKGRIIDEIGISAGPLVYQGDLSPSPAGAWKTARPALSAQATRITGARSALQASLLLGGLRGDEARYPSPAYRQERSLAFRTRVLELSAGGRWAPLGGFDGSRLVTPYLTGQTGLALLRVRPDASGMNGSFAPTENAAILPLLAADMAHRKPGLLPFASLGVGVRRQVADRWMMTLESGYRWTRSDHVDGFSRLANPDSRDHYAYHSVGLAYALPCGRGTRCPRPLR